VTTSGSDVVSSRDLEHFFEADVSIRREALGTIDPLLANARVFALLKQVASTDADDEIREIATRLAIAVAERIQRNRRQRTVWAAGLVFAFIIGLPTLLLWGKIRSAATRAQSSAVPAKLRTVTESNRPAVPQTKNDVMGMPLEGIVDAKADAALKCPLVTVRGRVKQIDPRGVLIRARYDYYLLLRSSELSRLQIQTGQIIEAHGRYLGVESPGIAVISCLTVRRGA